MLRPQLDDHTAVARAAIPIERSTGPLLLLSGRDDHLWPSTRMGEMLVSRMSRYGRAYDIEYVSYPLAGHARFTQPDPIAQPHPGVGLDLGGHPDGDARAQTDGWRRIAEFFARASVTGT